MLALSILHNVFVTPEEVQKLAAGEEIQIIGCSVPVWYQKGNTSEPAEEIFCKYKITNKPETMALKTLKGGYHINLPSMPKGYEEPKIGVEKWKRMSQREREVWTYENKIPPTVKRLLPIEQGGMDKLMFKEIQADRRNKKNVIIHIVEIKTMEYLESSLQY